MGNYFNTLGSKLYGGTRRAAGAAERGAERDASFFEREASRGAAPGRGVSEPRQPGHAPGGGRQPIDIGSPRGPGSSLAGGLGDLAMSALTSSEGVFALKTGAKLGAAYIMLMMARDYATNAFFGKDAMAAQAAAERGQGTPAPVIPGGTGLPGGGGALPDGTAISSGADVVRQASMTSQVASGMMATDRRYAVGMNAMDAAGGGSPPGSTVSSAIGPLAGGGSFFMLSEQSGPGVGRSFAAAAGPEGGVMSASRTGRLPNGVLERTAVEHGDGVASLAPMGPLDRTARVSLGPDAPAAAGRLSSALREPDAISPLLGSSGLSDMKAHAIQTGGTDRRSDVVFSGVGKDGKPVTGGMSFSDGAAKVTLFGPDGKTPVWSKDLDGSGVSMSPSGAPVLSGKSAAEAGAFVKSPSGFKEADDLAHGIGRPAASPSADVGRAPAASDVSHGVSTVEPVRHVQFGAGVRPTHHGRSGGPAGGATPVAQPVMEAAGGPSVAAPASAAPAAGKIEFSDWDRHPGSPSAVADAGAPSSGAAGGLRFASASPAGRSADAGGPLAAWAGLGAGRDDPAAGMVAALGKAGPSLGSGPGL